MKYKNKPINTYRSKLEQFCAESLEKEGIKFEYEPYKIELVPRFRSNILSYERVKKKFIAQSVNIRAITYTPDFVGDNWIIEVKGMKTPEFNIKWKLLKKYFHENNMNYVLYMPHNKREILQCISYIKNENQSCSKGSSFTSE